MDHTDWLILSTLLKEKNITTTAEKLFITQPALTYRIKNLERELETSLLIRLPKGVEFTSQGLIVGQYANDMIKKYNELQNIIFSMDKIVRGAVKLAITPAFAHYPFPLLLKDFYQAYPEVKIYINTDLSSVAVSKLMKDEIQIAIVRGNHNISCKSLLLDSQPIKLISKAKIDLKLLPYVPYIMYETDATLERDIANWWREHYDTPPQTIMKLNDSFTCRQMVDSGLGFTILPSHKSDAHQSFNFYELPLKGTDNQLLTRNSWLLYKEHTEKIAAARTFINFIYPRLIN